MKYTPFSLFTRLLAVSLICLVVGPLVLAVVRVFMPDGQLSTRPFVEAWSPGVVSVLLNTIIIVGASTASAVVVGVLLAWLIERTNARMGWIAGLLPVLPLMVPSLAGAIGWVLLASPGPGFINVLVRAGAQAIGIDLGLEGPLNIFSWSGLIFVYSLYLIPPVYLVVAAGMQNLDPSLEEAARSNGAGLRRTLLMVMLPALFPSILGGATLALISAFAIYSIPVLIATPIGIEVLSDRIVRLTIVEFPPKIGAAVVLGMVMVFFVGGAVWLQQRVGGLQRHATIGGRHTNRTVIDLGVWRWPARGMIAVFIVSTSVLPFIALLLVSMQPFWSANVSWKLLSFQNYTSLFSSHVGVRQAFVNTLGLAIFGATAAVAAGAVLAFFIQQERDSYLARAVDTSLKIPGTISHIVVAVAIIVAFVAPPFRLHGTYVILFLAYLVLYLPQASVSATASMAQLGTQLPEAARLSGAGPGRTFGKIVLPLVSPGLVAGWVFVFVLITGDLTASAMLATSRTPVVGFVMLDLINGGSFTSLAAIGALITFITSSVVLCVFVWNIRRRSGMILQS